MMITEHFAFDGKLYHSVTRCLSLTQPWATLIALGMKKFETRSWRTNYRGPLAIHAAKGFPRDCIALCYGEPFRSALLRAGYNNPAELPVGQVIAIVYLMDCVSTNHFKPAQHTDEFAFGDYSANRYAWQVDDVARIKPFDAKGALGIWKLPRPVTAEDLLP
jgi:hypothetical protein